MTKLRPTPSLCDSIIHLEDDKSSPELEQDLENIMAPIYFDQKVLKLKDSKASEILNLL